jgi:hypothetical protein
VEDPKGRATCAELRELPFLSVQVRLLSTPFVAHLARFALKFCILTAFWVLFQSMDAMRAQTAASLPKTAHTASTVTVHLPADFSFLKSPRDDDGDAEEAGGHHDVHRSRHSNTGAFPCGLWRDLCQLRLLYTPYVFFLFLL